MTSPQRADWLSRHPAILDTAVFTIAAGLLGLPSFLSIANETSGSAWAIACYVTLSLLHAVPLTRRRWPIETYAGALFAMAVFAVAPNISYEGAPAPAIMLPSVLLYFLALYEICAIDRRWAAEVAVGLAVVGAGFVVIRISTDDSFTAAPAVTTTTWPVLSAIALGGIAASWGLGRLRRTREQFRQGLEQQAALDERQRIAREMHDVVSHSLAVMITQAEGGRMSAVDPDSAMTFKTIGGVGRQALDDMRGLLGVLRDEQNGRSPAPTWQQIRQLTEQTTDAGLPTSYAETGDPSSLSGLASLAAFRITQESLTNAMKHAGPDAVADVVIAWGDQVHLQITTLGARREAPTAGGGTRSMRERAAAAGGAVDSRATENGWLVEATLPAGGSE